MPILPAGTPVAVKTKARDWLFGIPDGVPFVVFPHPTSVRSDATNQHTQVAGMQEEELVWLGAFGENLLTQAHGTPIDDVRARVGDIVLRGKNLWRIIRPGPLYRPGAPKQVSTAYAGDRPWLVVGELDCRKLVAAPLNEASNVQKFTPVVPSSHLLLLGSKESQVEINHLWSFPASVSRQGEMLPDSRPIVERALNEYFR